MKEYSEKEKKILMKNPYTLNVTKHKLIHTAKLSPSMYYKYITTGNYPLKDIITEPDSKEDI